jgi:hypothetical protein
MRSAIDNDGAIFYRVHEMRRQKRSQRSHKPWTVRLEHDEWATTSEPPQRSKECLARERIVARVLDHVGLDAEDQGRWILAFAHTDWSELSDKQRAALRRELLVFLIGEPLPGISKKRFARHVSDGIEIEGGQIPGTSELMLPEPETEGLHAWLREALAAIEAGRRFPFDFTVKRVVGLWPWAAEDEATPLQFAELKPAADVRERFAERVYETLRACGRVLRRCVECHALFVRSHGLERYCSGRCSQTVRTRAWRKTHPEKASELRKRQYEMDVTRKSGPAAARHIRHRKGT